MRNILGIWAALTMASVAQADLVWDQTTVERTLQVTSGIVEFAFLCTNPGEKPVRILHVQPTCSCTTGALEADTVAAGGRGKIMIYFDPQRLSGLQTKTVQVFTDERSTPTLLHLRLTIPELVSVSPRLLLWTIGEEKKPKTVVIRACSDARLKIAAVKSDDPALTAILTADEDGRSYRLSVEPHSTAMPFHGFVRFEALFDGAASRVMTLFAEVY